MTEEDKRVMILGIQNDQYAKSQALVKGISDAESDLMDQEQLFSMEIGQARDEEAVRQQVMKKIRTENINLLPQELAWLNKHIPVLAEKERLVKSAEAAEKRHLDHLERMASLGDQIEDVRGRGKSTEGFTFSTPNSLETRVNTSERAAKRDKLTFDRGAEEERIKKEMSEERVLAMDKVNTSLGVEFDKENDLTRLAGSGRAEREAEMMYLEKRNELRAQGIEMSPDEIANMRALATEVQAMKESAMGAEALNSFVDSLEVGFTQIGQSAQSAYGVMEDALVKFAQTGKLNFADLSKFIQTEIQRMIIRWLIWQAIKQGASFVMGSPGMGNVPDPAGNPIDTNSGGYPVEKYATGGSFTVPGSGGTDTTGVHFMATPGERVSVETPSQQQQQGEVGDGKVVVQLINSGASADAPPKVNVEKRMKETVIKIIFDDVKSNGPLRALMGGG